MIKYLSHSLTRRLFTVFLIVTSAAQSLVAEDVFVPSFIGTDKWGDTTPCPLSCTGTNGFDEEWNWHVYVSLEGSSASSTASPIPVVPAGVRRCVFGCTNDVNCL
jgi:hypothetical protein